MNRRQILAGIIAAPAIIKVAPLMRIKPHVYSFDDVELTFNNGGTGAISLSGFPIPNLPTIAPPWAGVIWNDKGVIRISQ